MVAKASLFAAKPASSPADDAGSADDYSGDSLPAGDSSDTSSADDTGGGPFDAYAETIFDPKADVTTKTDALRQAIMTLLEEQGAGGSSGPSVSGVLGKLGG